MSQTGGSRSSLVPEHKSKHSKPSILVIKTYVMAGRCLNSVVAAARFMSGIVRLVALHWGYFPSAAEARGLVRRHRRPTVRGPDGQFQDTAVRTILLLQSFQSVRTIDTSLSELVVLITPVSINISALFISSRHSFIFVYFFFNYTDVFKILISFCITFYLLLNW